MKYCRNVPPRRQPPTPTPAPDAPPPPDSTINRYCHPIRVKRPSRRSSTEELLNGILLCVSRQNELMEELLRRTSNENQDTR